MKNKSITLKRFFACVMVVIMAVTAVPMSGFAGLELSFRANALSTDENGDLVITAGETANVQIESNEITYLKFVPTASGVYTFTSLSSDDTYGYLYDSGKNQLTSDDDDGSGNNFRITYELTKGTTYYWGVRFYDRENSGSFDVRLTCDRVFCDHENMKSFDAVTATCTTDGYTAGVYCEDCETWLSGHTFTPAHHTYTNADTVCDVCGETATEVLYSGDCGEYGSNVTFTQYKGGLLVFGGSGAMCDFDYDDYNGCGDVPYRLNLVTAVIIGDGITRIGNYAFDLGVNIVSLSIPGSVTEIGSRAFHACRSLTELTLPDSVVTVGYEAFSECYGLSSLTIGKNVTTIGESAFSGCTGLTAVTIPDSVTGIGESAFYGCTGLTSLTIGNSVTSIGISAFSGCTGLMAVTIPDSVTGIGESAFYRCTGLTSLTIGNSVTAIGNSAFSGCTALSKINWNAESVGDFEENNRVFANAGNAGGIDVVFGDNVESIPAYAFCGRNYDDEIDEYVYDSANIKSVTIGKNVTSIGNYAFFCCTALSKINWNAESVGDFELNNGVFDDAGNAGGIDVVFGDSVTSIPAYAFCSGWYYDYDIEEYVYDSANIKSVTIGKNVTSIGNDAFTGCTSLTAVTIPDSVTTIGASAFYRCTGLTSLTIGNGVTSIGNSAFSGCTVLSKINWNAENVGDFEENSCVFDDAGNDGGIDVVFGDRVTKIPAYAFYCRSHYDDDIEKYVYDTANIKSVTIGKNVTSIGNYAFFCCTALSKINWNAENVGDFEEYNHVFDDAGNAGGIDVVFGDRVTSIPAYAFYCGSHYDDDIEKYVYDTANIISVTMSDSVERIGKYAFNEAAKDASAFEISDNLEKIGIGALDNTPWLEAQPYGDVYAGKVYYTYKGTMPENTSIVIKDGTKGIAGGALEYLENLSSITIPASVTNIGSDAFDGDYYWSCSFDVNIRDLSAWCRIEFENEFSNPLWSNTSLYLNGQEVTDLEIPDGITEIKDYAFYDLDSLRSVKIPSSVKTVGDYAFYECESLSNISIENGVERIGVCAFYETPVKNIILPDSVTEIGSSAFSNCPLSSVTIGNGVETVHERAFSSCSGLRTIKIGKNLKTVEAYAFSGLSNIPEIYFAGSEAEWKNVTIDKTNDMILRATMYYNADITHEHSYTSEVTTPATCTENGVKTFTCDCGKVYSEVIEATGHKTSSWITDKAATCTADGKKHKECTVCKKVLETAEVTASGHSFKNEVTAATCVSLGYETKTCRNCGECQFVRVIPAKGHTPSGWKIDNDKGIRYKDCTVCGSLLEAEKLDGCTHRFVSEVTDPTCTANGFELKTCADCGETRFVRVIAAKGHVLKTSVMPATFTESGFTTVSCKVCGTITKAVFIRRIASVALTKTAYTYNGKVQTPGVVVKDSAGKVLKNGTDYTVTYASGRKNPGKYAVKVTFKGNYTGSKTLYYTIAPAVPTVAVAAGSKRAVVKWTKQVGATGYVVYMATSANGKYTKIATVKNTVNSFTKKGLVTGRTYYFKVQAYTVSGGQTIYGGLSAAKGVKIK